MFLGVDVVTPKKSSAQLEAKLGKDIKAAIAADTAPPRKRGRPKGSVSKVPKPPKAPPTPVSNKTGKEKWAKGGNPAWKEGSGNPAGRPAHAKTKMANERAKFIANTGMTPLDFLTVVYRDQLYDDYDVEIINPVSGLSRCTPRVDPMTGEIIAEHIPMGIKERIAAASQVAPYMHRKMPIGIDDGRGGPIQFATSEQLAKLSDDDLASLQKVMSAIGAVTAPGLLLGAVVAEQSQEEK
jgi:hypothetical protein